MLGSQISGSCLRGSVMGPLPTAFSSGWLPSSTHGLCSQFVGFTPSVENQDAGETGVTSCLVSKSCPCALSNSLSALPQSLQHLLSIRSSASFYVLGIFLALLFSVIHLESIIITPVSHQDRLLSSPVVLWPHCPTQPGPGSFRWLPDPAAVPLEGIPTLCPVSSGAERGLERVPHPLSAWGWSPRDRCIPILRLSLVIWKVASPSFPHSRWNTDTGLRSVAASTLTTSSYLTWRKGVSPPVRG